VATLIIAPPSPGESGQTEEDLGYPPAQPEMTEPTAPKKADQLAQAMVLAILFAAPALMCVHSACANDPDIFWHLRTGEWIQQHHMIPRVDPFSGPNAGKPWPAYSWLFELLSIQLFQRFGLVGIVGYSAGMVLAITVAVQHLIKRLQTDFSVVILLTFASFFSLGHLMTPRPWMFTILFFVLEVDILMHARRTGKVRELAWLPLIFALWSNLHIQFIDGLIVLGLAAGESFVSLWMTKFRTGLGAKWAIGALGAAVLGTLANPFGWHIYRVAYDLASQPGVLDKINELQAVPFRSLTDFVMLFLALGTAAALAWTRRLQLFEVGAFLFAALVSFRSQRDVWVMTTVAAAILASTIVGKNKTRLRMPRFSTPLAVAAAALIVLGGFRVMRVNDHLLKDQVAKTMPVDAVHFIQAKGYSGPLYNDFNWGGYLIWSLRTPVSIDGRAAFYGDKAIDSSVATWKAEPEWKTNPELTSAGIVLGPAKSSLVQVLRMDPRFRLVYEDKVAAVLIPQK